jgi:hypothetical protein
MRTMACEMGCSQVVPELMSQRAHVPRERARVGRLHGGVVVVGAGLAHQRLHAAPAPVERGLVHARLVRDGVHGQPHAAVARKDGERRVEHLTLHALAAALGAASDGSGVVRRARGGEPTCEENTF